MVVNQALDSAYVRRRYQDVPQAQQEIYDFLIMIVKTLPADEVLVEFSHLFLQHQDTTSGSATPALYAILVSNQEQEFCHTLKRCCYILINNWELAREYEAIRQLIQLFSDPIIYKASVSFTIKRLRQWLANFVEGDDFRDLKLFVENRFKTDSQSWSDRYTSYLLVSQYIDTDNPQEQREAAKILSKRLRDKFRLDLAMYTAHSQGSGASYGHHHNPTNLGDGALRLIKTIVAKRGQFSYHNIARIFHDQTYGISYLSYKRSLVRYLVFAINQTDCINRLQATLARKLDSLYVQHDQRPIDPSLKLRTSNRIIDYLTTEDHKTPSFLFTLMLSSSSPLILAVLLLKLVLASPSSHLYLDARIADLIRYYEQFPQAQCQWVINFLEVYSVTLAICDSDVEYNLVRIRQDTSSACAPTSLDDYRIFSQMMKGIHQSVAMASDRFDLIDGQLAD